MITSTSNSRVKNVALLMKKGKARKEQKLFVIEGERLVKDAPAELLTEIYMTEAFSKTESGQMLLIRENAEVVSDQVFNYMADTNTPQGVLAVAKMPSYSMEDMLTEKPLILITETVQDPGNLGTMIRTAEAAGASGIIMSTDTVDVYSPKVVRATMSSIFRMPHIVAANLPCALDELKNRGVKLYAAHLKGKHSYSECNYNIPAGFLIGNEGNGLSDEIASKADEYLIIPMEGQIESLNAGMAAGILMYEAHRQRSL